MELRIYIYAMAAILNIASIEAHPSKLSVVSGSAEVLSDALTQEIRVSDKAILEWDTFSIGSKEVLCYIQPSSMSVALNRVVTGAPSELLGRLEANGKVYLINPNGVLIGKDAYIKTAGFLASTLDLSDTEFLEGKDLSFKGKSNAPLIHLGNIECTLGDVALFAKTIEQQGDIQASRGTVFLGCGSEIYLKPEGEKRLFIRCSSFSDLEETAVGLNLDGKIASLRSEIQAEGNPYGRAIHQKGSIQATGLQQEGGRVFLVAECGEIQVQGEIVGREGEKGGIIHLCGPRVSILEGARIDVSAPQGRGCIVIGKAFSGLKQEMIETQHILIADEAVILADALEFGDAGKVIVSAQESTDFQGLIFSRGGRFGGNGGFVEVSGKRLNYQGLADCTACSGKTGTVLMDPTSIIVATPDMNVLISPTIQPTASPSQISPASLVGQLAMSNVLVQPSTAGVGPGDITVNEDVMYSSANSLTLSNQNLIGSGNTGRITISPAVSINNTGTGDIRLLSVDTISVQGIVQAMDGEVELEAAGGVFVGGNLYNSSGPAGVVGSGTNRVSVTTTGLNSDIIVRGGNMMSQPSLILSGTGHVSITSGRDVIVQGDTDSSSASISSPLGGVIVSAARDVLVLGGAGNMAEAGILSAGNAGLRVDAGRDLIMFGGGTNSGSEIFARDDAIVNIGGNISAASGASGAAVLLSTFDQGSLRITASGNIMALGTNSDAVNFLVPLGNGGLSIWAGGNISLDHSLVSQTGTGSVLVQAGQNLSLNTSIVQSRFKQISLVVDAEFPQAPLLGTGSFLMDSASAIQSVDPMNPVPIRIFSSRREQNSIIGSLNGQSFFPGTLFNNASTTEQWGAYYFNAYGGSPYTVFYKNTPLTFPPQPSVANEFVIAMNEALQEWKAHDDLLYIAKEFSIRIASEWAFDKRFSQEYLSWVSVMQDKAYPWMRRMYRTYNMKGIDPL